MTARGPSQAPSRLQPPEARWVEPAAPDMATVTALQEALRLPAVVCSILAARGITDPEAAKAFLRPELDQLHDPATLADGEVAAKRIRTAIEDGERIFVHGDYDVDGICAAALLTRWLRSLGADVVPFVPHRLRDGYDFSEAGLAKARDAGASLIVTADCGTVAFETIARAREEGIDVVVTDHHTVGDALPEAVAVVNPQRPDCDYPEKGLCGAGLAYKLCELVARELGADVAPLVELLDLVAMATVADLVPLKDENRVLVRFGLRRFADTRVPGISALLAVAGIDPVRVTAGNIGYVVAPRINAAGRIGESADALELLLTEDRARATRLAEALDAINTERREEDRRTFDEALTLLEREYDAERDRGVVLAAEGWHPGVIGIVASRVVERIHRPAVLVALDGERGRGSARSVPGFHLYEALAECREHLGRFGGHKQAAGMDVARASVPALREAFDDAARRRLEPDQLRPTRRPDLEVRLGDLDLQLVHWLDYLSPHGMGNPGPRLLARGVVVERAKLAGEAHLKATLVQGRDRIDFIAFGFAERFRPGEIEGGTFDVIFRVERNEWRRRVTVQAKLEDLRPSATR